MEIIPNIMPIIIFSSSFSGVIARTCRRHSSCLRRLIWFTSKNEKRGAILRNPGLGQRRNVLSASAYCITTWRDNWSKWHLLITVSSSHRGVIKLLINLFSDHHKFNNLSNQSKHIDEKWFTKNLRNLNAAKKFWLCFHLVILFLHQAIF